MHLMITFQQLEPKLLMRYPLLLMVQVMPITLSAATTSSFSVQLVVAMFFILNKLSKSKATALDNISPKLIRECEDLFLVPLRNIFNKSLSSGLFPDDWKCTRVTPLFKQGERTDVNNYRPICVISVIAKVFERIVYDQLYSCLANEEIITHQQSGFRSLHSTVTALLEANDSWAFNIDRGNVNAVVFLDLKKSIILIPLITMYVDHCTEYRSLLTIGLSRI